MLKYPQHHLSNILRMSPLQLVAYEGQCWCGLVVMSLGEGLEVSCNTRMGVV